MVLSVTLALGTACAGEGPPAVDPSSNSGSTANGEIPMDIAKSRAATAVSGGVAGDARKEDEKDEHRWLVDVKLPNGSVVVVEVDRKGGAVAEITGEKGPYDYDFAPGDGFLRFADAKSKALSAKVGDVKEWEIDVEKSQYEFLILGSDRKLYEVTIDAKNGALKGVAEKSKK
jgi:uncharacterized membrane protein YkoI